MRTLPLLVLLAACAAPPPIGTIGPSDPGAHTATTLAHSGTGPVHSASGPTHSAYVVPDLPPPMPGPLVLERSGGFYDYVLEMVVAGPGEWDQFVADEAAAGSPHYGGDAPCCSPLPDAAEAGITDDSSWLVFSRDQLGDKGWQVLGAEVMADGTIEVRWGTCGYNDGFSLSGAFFPIPRAAYTGVRRIREGIDGECNW
jgi:hypothetical protein